MSNHLDILRLNAFIERKTCDRNSYCGILIYPTVGLCTEKASSYCKGLFTDFYRVLYRHNLIYNKVSIYTTGVSLLIHI